MFLSSNLLYSSVIDISVISYGLSDHHIVCMKLHDSSTPHGQGRWICNNSLRKDEDCNFRFIIFWKYWITQKHNYDTLADWWESGKFRIKEIIKEYGKEKASVQKQRQVNLQKQYASLLSKGLNSDDDAINQIETELKTYETNEWKNAKIRTRNTIKDESEKASKYFLNLEKQQINDGKIDKLLTNDGNYADQPDTMLNCANIFYSNLYKEEEISDFHLQDIISKIKTKQIPDDIHSNLDCEITANEVRTAIFQMKKK